MLEVRVVQHDICAFPGSGLIQVQTLARNVTECVLIPYSSGIDSAAARVADDGSLDCDLEGHFS